MNYQSSHEDEKIKHQGDKLEEWQYGIVYTFMVFMVLKTLAFDFSFYGYVKRYRKTYGTWNQVEIWLLILAAVKLTFLLPNYFF